MRKYTANYAYTNPNFVIQNLDNNHYNTDILPILYVLKNILQRGFPTTMSKFLQSKLGEIHTFENFEERFLFVSNHLPVWYNTIKGSKDLDYYPAKEFFEEIIPHEFGEYAFIQSLLIPEIEITDITGEYESEFIDQQIDFYLPQAKLVIEIDGQQHMSETVNKELDEKRDKYLKQKGIETIRISTDELTNKTYSLKIKKIIEQLKRYDRFFNYYKDAIQLIETNQINEEQIRTKLLPTAIIRFQILLLELLTHKYLNFKEDWNFHVFCHEDIPNFAELAIKDLFIWLTQLWKLKNKQDLILPKYSINLVSNKSIFKPSPKTINIDFSLFKRYTDENKINRDILFVRTDYFDFNAGRNEIGLDKNYFKVSTTESINYKITNDDKETLEFFLLNIFDKPKFRDGQFPVLSNVLNRKDTIGLLPTGGGKSICYQLPCLLQPSINFVICPIKSLMYDQNDNLAKTFITNVNFITSDLEKEEKWTVENNFEQGKYLFVWISPEKLQIPAFRERISSIISNFSISYAVIDEVHCLSEWGHDFRTSYLNLAKTIDKISPKDDIGEGTIKFIGLTATASVHVLKDIKIEFSRQKKQLEDENIKSLLDYSRKELQFEVINDNGNKITVIRELLEKLKESENFIETKEKASLIFTPNVNGNYGCYELSNILNTIYPEKVNWFSGEVPKRNVYNPETGKNIKKPIMSKEEFNKHKQETQKKFKNDVYQVLVATKAFGMGIDKQNIYYTFHYGLPSSVEALYQEAGRAGRWDKGKQENINKIGKCFVLHSPETLDLKRVERLFHKDTTFFEMKKISEEVGFSGMDIFRQVFLFIQGQNDVDSDYDLILKIISLYFKENSHIRIFWNDVLIKFGIKDDILQKVIYRLSLLGIVSDWTTNFINHYEVHFQTLNEEHIIKNISNYILKYEPNTDIKTDLLKVPMKTVLEKAIWYILNWIFENIAYNRKQSLKTLSDWCSEFDNSEGFKQRIDNYFIFTETTFVLQHISENPEDYEKWFEVLISEKKFPEKKEFEVLRDSISRFLESYRNSTGLNFLSGFSRLALNDYNNSDGRERFESALYNIKRNFSKEKQVDILHKIKVLGSNLMEEQKMELCQSISKYYPEMLEELAEYYALHYLLNDIYAEKIKEIKKLNHKLYVQLTKI